MLFSACSSSEAAILQRICYTSYKHRQHNLYTESGSSEQHYLLCTCNTCQILHSMCPDVCTFATTAIFICSPASVVWANNAMLLSKAQSTNLVLPQLLAKYTCLPSTDQLHEAAATYLCHSAQARYAVICSQRAKLWLGGMGVPVFECQFQIDSAEVLSREAWVHSRVGVVVHAGLLWQALGDFQIGWELGGVDIACACTFGYFPNHAISD